MSTDFKPDWGSPPGDTIKDMMQEQGIDSKTLAGRLGIELNYMPHLYAGEDKIHLALAEKLAEALGSTPEFWLERERLYRESVIERLEVLMRSDLKDWEQAFPIYRISAKWSEEQDPEKTPVPNRPNMPPLPEDRYWNSTGFSKMYREDLGIEVIEAELEQAWWPEFEKKRRNPDDVQITVTLDRHDVWCDSWFSHWTFDIGASDMDVMDSFHRYVFRIEGSRLTSGQKRGILMGAEDVWRWHATKDGDPNGERTEPPCRCPHCKKLGIVRVDH